VEKFLFFFFKEFEKNDNDNEMLTNEEESLENDEIDEITINPNNYDEQLDLNENEQTFVLKRKSNLTFFSFFFKLV
jgi:hypothetical protein